MSEEEGDDEEDDDIPYNPKVSLWNGQTAQWCKREHTSFPGGGKLARRPEEDNPGMYYERRNPQESFFWQHSKEKLADSLSTLKTCRLKTPPPTTHFI